MTTDRLSTVEILSRSVKNGTFITLLQALAIPRVMVVLKMPSCKSLLMKARADKRDPLLALLEWRNTPTEGMHASPSQLLYGRRTRTRLPVAKTLLEPRVITNVPKMIEMRKQKQKHYYDQHTHELPKLDNGDAIMVPWTGHWRCRQPFLSGRGEWETVSSKPLMVKGHS